MPGRIELEILLQVEQVVRRHWKLFHIGYRSGSAAGNVAVLERPETENSFRFVPLFQRIHQGHEWDLAFTDNDVIDHTRLQTFFGVR